MCQRVLYRVIYNKGISHGRLHLLDVNTSYTFTLITTFTYLIQISNPTDRHVNYDNALHNALSGFDPLNTRMSPVDFVWKWYASTLPNVTMSVLIYS